MMNGSFNQVLCRNSSGKHLFIKEAGGLWARMLEIPAKLNRRKLPEKIVDDTDTLIFTELTDPSITVH